MSPKVSILILAAGASLRMKKTKQLLPWQGKTLVEHALEIAVNSNAQNVYLVLGANHEKILGAIAVKEVEVVVNDNWESGMGSSISSGVGEMLAADKPDGILVMLADQPLVDTDLLNKLIDTFIQSGKDVVGTVYPTKIGVPVVFSSSIFPDLLALKGREGAWVVISKHRDNSIAIDAGQRTIDIDTQDDYRSIYNTYHDQKSPH